MAEVDDLVLGCGAHDRRLAGTPLPRQPPSAWFTATTTSASWLTVYVGASRLTCTRSRFSCAVATLGGGQVMVKLPDSAFTPVPSGCVSATSTYCTLR